MWTKIKAAWRWLTAPMTDEEKAEMQIW